MTKRISQILHKKKGRPRESKTVLPEDYTDQQARFLVMVEKWKQDNNIKFPTNVQIGKIWDESKKKLDISLPGA